MKKPQGKNIMACPIPQGDHNNIVYLTNPRDALHHGKRVANKGGRSL